MTNYYKFITVVSKSIVEWNRLRLRFYNKPSSGFIKALKKHAKIIVVLKQGFLLHGKSSFICDLGSKTFMRKSQNSDPKLGMLIESFNSGMISWIKDPESL